MKLHLRDCNPQSSSFSCVLAILQHEMLHKALWLCISWKVEQAFCKALPIATEGAMPAEQGQLWQCSGIRACNDDCRCTRVFDPPGKGHSAACGWPPASHAEETQTGTAHAMVVESEQLHSTIHTFLLLT